MYQLKSISFAIKSCIGSNGQKNFEKLQKEQTKKVHNVKKADVAKIISYSMRYNTKSVLLRDI